MVKTIMPIWVFFLISPKQFLNEQNLKSTVRFSKILCHNFYTQLFLSNIVKLTSSGVHRKGISHLFWWNTLYSHLSWIIVILLLRHDDDVHDEVQPDEDENGNWKSRGIEMSYGYFISKSLEVPITLRCILSWLPLTQSD